MKSAVRTFPLGKGLCDWQIIEIAFLLSHQLSSVNQISIRKNRVHLTRCFCPFFFFFYKLLMRSHCGVLNLELWISSRPLKVCFNS